MLLLLFIISILTYLVLKGIYKYYNRKIDSHGYNEIGRDKWLNRRYLSSCYDDECYIFIFVSLCLFAASLFFVILYSTSTQNLELYQNENIIIEEKITNTVSTYMKYEKDTFVELKDQDIVSLISLFPELKSDTLVQKQMDVYMYNHKQIVECKKNVILLNMWKNIVFWGWGN